VFYCRINASPEVKGCSIANILNVDDLPAPFGPKSPKIEPYLTPNELPHTASSPF